MTTSTLTQRHRAQQLLIRRDTATKVAQIWPTLRYDALEESFPALAARMATLVQANRQVSAGLAARYLREVRREAGLAGAPRLVLPEAVPGEQLMTSLHATTVAPIKASAARGVATDLAMAQARTLATGAVARLVLNAGRETLTRTATAEGAGWQRVLGGAGCDFCQMLAGRGAVYGEESSDFEAHDHCGCTAEPVYG